MGQLKPTPIEGERHLLKEIDKLVEFQHDSGKKVKRVALSPGQMDKVYQMLRRKNEFPRENAELKLGQVEVGIEYRGVILYRQ